MGEYYDMRMNDFNHAAESYDRAEPDYDDELEEPDEPFMDDEPDDDYPKTITEKVGYSEYVIIHALENIAPAIWRLNHLHCLLMLEGKDPANKLPDIILNDELRIALRPLLQVENDIKDITEMLIPIYRATKPQESEATK